MLSLDRNLIKKIDTHKKAPREGHVQPIASAGYADYRKPVMNERSEGKFILPLASQLVRILIDQKYQYRLTNGSQECMSLIFIFLRIKLFTVIQIFIYCTTKSCNNLRIFYGGNGKVPGEVYFKLLRFYGCYLSLKTVEQDAML